MKFKQVHEFLLQVQKHIDPKGVVAGGYLRDIVLGVQPKDVDVWVYNSIPKELPLELEGEWKVTRHIWVHNSLSIKCIVTVWWKDTHFDLIQLKDRSIAAIDRFDFGINRIYYDGVSLYKSREFNNDVKDKRIGYVNTSENYLRLDRIVKDRVPRMLAKYPHFQVSTFLNATGDDLRPILLKQLINRLIRTRAEDITDLDKLCWNNLQERGHVTLEEGTPVSLLDDVVLVKGQRPGVFTQLEGQPITIVPADHNPSVF